MKDPIADFKSAVVRCKPNDVHVYHVGFLGSDISSSPTLTNIQMFAYGLYLMGRVGLRQQRVTIKTDIAEIDIFKTEYSMRILQPVHTLDFDTARKAYLNSVRA